MSQNGSESSTPESKSDATVVKTLFEAAMGSPAMAQGLRNLALFPPLDPAAKTPAPYRGKPFSPAAIGFKRFGQDDVQIALAVQGGMPRYIPMAKFIPMVELLHHPKHCTVVLQNYQTASDRREGRGQVLARILPENSAINVALGNQGVPIRDESDILRIDSYQIDRTVLTTYYLACKYQISGADRLDELIASFEGLRFYDLRGTDDTDALEAVAALLG